MQVQLSLLVELSSVFLFERMAEAVHANQGRAQVVRDGVAERVQLAVDFAQFHDATLQAVVQPVNLIFRSPELRVGILQLAVLLFEQLGVVLQQGILAG